MTTPDSFTMTPRDAALDLEPYELPVRSPFLLDLRVAADAASAVVPHVSNVEVVRWLDGAAEMHAEALGCARAWLLERGAMWFVARHEIDYRAEAWPDDEMVMATWVEDVQRVRSWRSYAVLRPRDETVICRARTLWVLVDLESRRPTRLPDSIATHLRAVATGRGSAE